MKAWLAKLYWCWLWHMHDGTCAAAEGVKPTQEQLTTGVVGFLDYAKMYCKRCGKIYQPEAMKWTKSKSSR